MAGAERGVAGADDGEVAVQDAFAVENSAGHDVGSPGERVDREQAVCGSGGEELGVGRGDEELGFIEAVEGLAVKGDDADAEFGLIKRWVGQDGCNAVSEWTFGGGGVSGGVVRRRLV